MLCVVIHELSPWHLTWLLLVCRAIWLLGAPVREPEVCGSWLMYPSLCGDACGDSELTHRPLWASASPLCWDKFFCFAVQHTHWAMYSDLTGPGLSLDLFLVYKKNTVRFLIFMRSSRSVLGELFVFSVLKRISRINAWLAGINHCMRRGFKMHRVVTGRLCVWGDKTGPAEETCLLCGTELGLCWLQSMFAQWRLWVTVWRGGVVVVGYKLFTILAC